MNRLSWPAFILTILIACEPLGAADIPTHEFDIPAAPLGEALNVLARQSGLQIAMDPREGRGVTTRPVVGTYTAQAALTELLRNTGLTFRFLNARTVAIRAAPPARPQSAPNTAAAEIAPEAPLDEVVVTGTHVRGGETASPLLVYERVDIERSGAATAPQFLTTIPQNFGGGHSDRSNNEVSLQPDPSFGTAVNLRGLGSGTTLVLVNGRRSALGGSAQFVDVSMIPLSAVERIDVLTDGASAIYGSDALGGVVNFVMRDDYEGAETALRAGATTHGDGDQYLASQSYGHRWDSGNALVFYEYSQSDAVFANRRPFSRDVEWAADLVPEQQRHSVYTALHQNVSDALSLSIDGLHSERSTGFAAWDAFAETLNVTSAGTKQYGGSLGAELRLGKSWRMEVSAGMNRNDIRNRHFAPDGVTGPGFFFYQQSTYDLEYAQTLLSGTAWALPTGDLRLALGTSYRQESYVSSDPLSNISGTYEARAAFGELQVPLARTVMLTLAGRYEDYTTFGETFDPKFGLRWSPSPSLRLRATYGTSFHAPSAYQLDDFNATHTLRNLPDPLGPNGISRTVVRLGNNADLHEETARSWTAGIDFSPLAWPGFEASLTWFRIDYSGRIQSPSLHFLQGFSDPRYAKLITRRGDMPDAEFDAFVAELLSGRAHVSRCPVALDPVTGACAEPPSNFDAVYDSRVLNLAGLRTSGLDFLARQQLPTSVGTFDINLNVSYLFDYEQQVTSIAPYVEYVDTALNPLALRARATIDWTRGRFGIMGAVNYANRYTNNTTIPSRAIAAWTTVDLNVRYELAQTSIGLFVTNALDRDPPAFTNFDLVGRPLGYDPANADPLGRTVSLQVRRRW